MATAWIAAATAMVGWLVSPIIAIFLPKILSHLGCDASKKLQELELNIMPDLETTLREVDQARMLQRGDARRVKSEVATLDKMAALLRHAREDAEDIFDDQQEIELYRNRCWKRLYGAVKAWACIVVGYGYGPVKTCIARCMGLLHRDPELDYEGNETEVRELIRKRRATQLANKLRHRLYGAVATCKSRCARLLQWAGMILGGTVVSTCTMWIASITGSGSARLLHWARNRFQDLDPIHRAAAASHAHAVDIPEAALSGSASHEEVVSEATPSESASVLEAVSHEQALVLAVATPSGSASHVQALVPGTAYSDPSCSYLDSLGRCFSCLCRSFDFSMHCSRSMLYWIIAVIAVSRSYRNSFYQNYLYPNWSYEMVGITSYQQENGTALDFLLAAISRRNLKKRIEKIESTVTEVKKSSLLAVPSKTPPDEIANKDRSRIRIASNRKVFGRKALRDTIMAKIRQMPHGDAPSSSSSPCYSVIGIYGVAGSGKTTFARYTLDYIKEECNEEKLFDIIMCIHVSETFTVANIFHEMLKDITKDQHSNISDREELEEKLKESLRGKRFFLILDDLWVKTKNDPQMEELISPLNVGLKGSIILVTARTKFAAGALCADEPIEMPDLHEDQFLSMFMHYSLGGINVDEEFERVGTVIAKNLHGSPIAAVVVAGRLGANRDIKFWKKIAEHDMLNGTMDALWWSYQQLSSDIKRCFEYCNIFPRRFKMKKDDLVHLWIAQGIVKTNCATEDMEDVAEGYIQELVSCSFLQPEKTWMAEESFRIHDLLHDLVDMVTRTDCFRIENESSQRGKGWKGDIPRDVCHLFVHNYDAKLITENKILKFVNLRSLIIYVVEDDTPVEEKVIESICQRLPKLRVLAIGFSQEHDPIRQPNKFTVPEAVGQLKYLRYLAFRTHWTCRITLPSALNNLKYIQVLDFDGGIISEFTFSELVNLRHIFCCEGVKLPYLGRLISLQTLPGFTVSNEQGCELKQLRDLNKLREKLVIYGLENVESKGQALEANLASKDGLTELSLFADGGWSETADVLQGLCPPIGLKKLEIFNPPCLSYPDWMVGKHSAGPKYLQKLYIVRCCKRLPPSGLLDAFPHLRVLVLSDCSWEALPKNMEHLTSLKELWISQCNYIWSLPSLPQSLESFLLNDCDDEFTKSCQTVGHPNWQKIEHIPKKYIP